VSGDRALAVLEGDEGQALVSAAQRARVGAGVDDRQVGVVLPVGKE
jgi:hypothetical protein